MSLSAQQIVKWNEFDSVALKTNTNLEGMLLVDSEHALQHCAWIA